jgi:hypothetical protein
MNNTMVSVRDDASGEVILRTSRQFLMDSIAAKQDAQEQLELHRIRGDQIAIIKQATADLKAADRQDKVSRLCDGIATLARRCDALTARRDEEHEAAEQQLIKQTLDALPDPDDPHWENAGELTTLGQTEPKFEEQLEAADQGDLRRELTEKVPVDPGTDPDLSGSREPTARTPAAFGAW